MMSEQQVRAYVEGLLGRRLRASVSADEALAMLRQHVQAQRARIRSLSRLMRDKERVVDVA